MLSTLSLVKQQSFAVLLINRLLLLEDSCSLVGGDLCQQNISEKQNNEYYANKLTFAVLANVNSTNRSALRISISLDYFLFTKSDVTHINPEKVRDPNVP